MSKKRSSEEWSKLIQQYRRSGTSQKAFCDRHGLSTGSLQYQLARSPKTELAAVPVGFVELGTPGNVPRVELEIVFPNGAALRLRG